MKYLNVVKVLILTIAFLFLAYSLYPQAGKGWEIRSNTKSRYDTCAVVKYLTYDKNISKLNGILTIRMVSKLNRTFKDIKRDDAWVEYNHIGKVFNLDFSLIKMTDFNDELFLLLNRESGNIDTLFGRPVFSGDHKYFSCFNNPGTDGKSKIQLFEFQNSKTRKLLAFEITEPIIIWDLRCITQNFVLVKDHMDKYWMISEK